MMHYYAYTPPEQCLEIKFSHCIYPLTLAMHVAMIHRMSVHYEK